MTREHVGKNTNKLTLTYLYGVDTRCCVLAYKELRKKPVSKTNVSKLLVRKLSVHVFYMNLERDVLSISGVVDN